MDELLNRFLAAIRPQSAQQAATSPMTVPQAGMLNRLIGLAQAQSKGAMQAAPEQLAKSRQLLADWNPGQEINPELMNQFMNLAGFAPMGITAYHGSPYLFRQFDPAKVGAGEGAQAYGVGAGYTAEARPVAEGYRRATTMDRFATPSGIFKPSSLEHLNVKATFRKDGLENAIELAKKYSVPDADYPEVAAQAARDLQVLQSLKQSGGVQPIQGYLYKGDIPDEILPRFLDWDKPLTKDAPQEVKDAFNSIVQKYPELKEPFFKAFKENQLGSHYYSLLNDYAKTGDLYKNQLFASQTLEEAGIRGIRYLDQGSRAEGKGTSNFIPFRPEDYKVQEINDIPIEEWISKGLL